MSTTKNNQRSVEHVHVNDGGQAVIGNVKKQDAQD